MVESDKTIRPPPPIFDARTTEFGARAPDFDAKRTDFGLKATDFDTIATDFDAKATNVVAIFLFMSYLMNWI